MSSETQPSISDSDLLKRAVTLENIAKHHEGGRKDWYRRPLRAAARDLRRLHALLVERGEVAE